MSARRRLEDQLAIAHANLVVAKEAVRTEQERFRAENPMVAAMLDDPKVQADLAVQIEALKIVTLARYSH